MRYSLKNSIYIENKNSTGSSNSLISHYPPISSTIYKLLSKTKALHLFTSSLDEFGMGSAGIFCNEGIVHNFRSPRRVVGGSSSGSAHLLARNFIDFAIVTDTGGSARVPASYNSIYGFKPSFGLISREGILPLCTLLDTPSILSCSISIIARVLSIISAPDPADLTTLKTKKKKYYPLNKSPEKDFSTPLVSKKYRFVVIKETYQTGERFLNRREKKIRNHFGKLLLRLKYELEANIIISSLKWPPLDLTELIYKIVAYSELVTHYLSLNSIVTPWIKLDEFENTSEVEAKENSRLTQLKVKQEYISSSEKVRAEMGSEVKIRHLLGFFFLYRDNYLNIYVKARKVITLWRKYLNKLLENGEILISPTTEDIAPLISKYSNAYIKDSFQSLVLLANFGGLPAISIPWLNFKSTLDSSIVHVGLHLICRYREDKYLLSIASLLENSKLL